MKPIETKSKRGGKRAGAGRPSLGKRASITVRLPLALTEKLRNICVNQKQSQSAVIGKLLN